MCKIPRGPGSVYSTVYCKLYQVSLRNIGTPAADVVYRVKYKYTRPYNITSRYLYLYFTIDNISAYTYV